MLTSLRLLSAPPVLLDVNLVIQHTRIDNYADVNLVSVYMATATSMAETYLNRALGTQTLSYTMAHTRPPNTWPMAFGFLVPPLNFQFELLHQGHPFELPRSPVASVTSIASGTWTAPDVQLVLGTDYYQDLTTDPARIKLQFNNNNTPYNGHDHITVTYVAGYTATSQVIPQPILNAIMVMTAHLYENRGDSANAVTLTPQAKGLLDPYRLFKFAEV